MSSPQTVREFAEQVLMGSTLGDKLTPPPPGLVLDAPQRCSFSAPPLPGRPEHLKPCSNNGKSPFPSDDQVCHEEQRGILLHFFANHELLAVELMALALLKFPDAPDAFRKGVLHTLKEEQNHTRWYLERMKECGLSLGDYHLSPMIWSHISSMESPLDYISRLSLTFEQANLDYARHYSRVLAQVGDQASSDLLSKIYKDEIAHVGYGLKWLRRWKQAAQSDWDAWHRRLHFPLSPIRAKGLVPFNEDGRRKAGFTEDFITSLRHFQSSRGRSPDLYWFNPEVELTADEPTRTPSRRIQDLAADLEFAFALAAPGLDDLVLLRRLPGSDLRTSLSRHGLFFPETAPLAEQERIRQSRKIRQEVPWGQSRPEVLSKEFGARLRQLADPEGIPSAICDNPRTLAAFVARHPYEDWVAKPLLGSAGRGLLRFSRTDLPVLQRPHLIEPRLKPLREFSLLFQSNPPDRGGLRFLGLCHQKVSPTGRWLASISSPKPAAGLPVEEARLLTQEVIPGAKKETAAALQILLKETPYFGPIAVDSFLHETDGKIRWHRVSEINARWSMGRLAHQLRLKMSPTRPLTLTTLPKGSPHTPGVIALGDPGQCFARFPVVIIS